MAVIKDKLPYRKVSDKSIEKRSKPIITVDQNPAKKVTTADAVNDISTNLQSLLYNMLPELKTGVEQATSIPYLYNMLGDFITNPSTVSIDTFRRMATTDPAINSALNYHSAIIGSTIGEYYHNNPQIQEIVRFNLLHLEHGGFRRLIKEMLSSLWAGYFLGEMAATQENGFYQIKHVTPIPPITTIFAVDNHGRVKDKNGIFQYVINSYAPGFQSFNVAGGGYSPVGSGYAPLDVDPFADGGDYAYPIRQPYANLFGLNPLDTKMMIHFNPSNIYSLGNPYGQSVLRGIYSLYVLKYGVLQFLSQALYKKSMPLLVIKYDGTLQTQGINGASQPLANSILASAESATGNSVITFPTINGVEVEAIKIEGDLQIFYAILEYIDRSIYMGLGTPPTLGNSSTGSASHSSSYMQDSMHNKLISDKREDITQCLLNSLIKKIIENNFHYGKDFQDYGYFKENALSIDDKLKLSKLYETELACGIMDNTQQFDLAAMREVLGNKVSNEILDKITERNKSMLQSVQNVNHRVVKDDTETPYSHWNDK